MFANLSFWYHLPYSEIRSMPLSAIHLYLDRLPKQQAAIRLMIGEGATVPHLEEDARREWSGDLNELLNDGKHKIKITPPAVLKMIGIGVEFVQ